MSTQTRHGPYGLPEVYQVYIPKDRTECPYKEFNKIMELAAPKSSPRGGQSGGWHRIGNGYYHPQDDKYPDIPEVSYSDWKKAILGEPDPVYKVGDWVVPLTKTGYREPGKLCKVEGEIDEEGLRMLTPEGRSDGNGWYRYNEIRHATPEEVEKVTTPVGKYITPVVGKWYTCLDGYNTKPDGGGSGYKIGKIFECRDVTLLLNTSKGGAVLWPKDGHAGIYNRAVREATQEEVDIATGKKKPAKDGKEWICTSEDKVELYDGDIVQWVKIDDSSLYRPSNITKKHNIEDVLKYWKLFSTEQAAKDWIEQQSGTGWKVGDILSTKDLEKYPNYRGQNGERRKSISAQHFGKDRHVAEVKDGWALISGTINIWLPPKHQCTPLPVEDKGWDTNSKIWYNGYSEYQKYWMPVLQPDGKYRIHVEGDSSPGSAIYTEEEITKRIKRGIWTLTKPTKPVDPVKQVPVTISEAKEWVPKVGDWIVWGSSGDPKPYQLSRYNSPTDWAVYYKDGESSYTRPFEECRIRKATPEEIAKAQGTQIPVTAENAVIGMRVVRGKDWKWGDQDTEDGVQQVGTIIEDEKNFPINPANRWVRVKWDYGRSDTYQIGAYDEYDLYIASDNTITKPESQLMKVIDLKEKECIHCSTEEEAKEICRLMHEAGMKWCSGQSYIENVEWDSYEEDTCYHPSDGTFCDITYYKEEGYIIHKASKFIKQSINNNQTKTKNNDKENHSSKQQDSSISSKSISAVNLSADSPTIVSRDRRTATAVRCDRLPIFTDRQYRRNAKAVELS